ncbi:MAG: HU family DNA-binding protein [Bacteroides sp.]
MSGKDDFARKLAKKGYSLALSKKICDDFIQVITQEVARGNEVSFPNFGAFEVRRVAPRLINDFKNPGQKMMTREQIYPAFRASEYFKKVTYEGFAPRKESNEVVECRRYDGVIERRDRCAKRSRVD